MINILHINRNYLGSSVHKAMLEHLDKDAFCSTTFVPVSKGEDRTNLNDERVIVDSCFNKYDKFFYSLKQYKIYKTLRKEVKNIHEYNLVHAHTVFTDGNIANKIYRKYEIPYVVTVRNSDINGYLKIKPYYKYKAIKILNNAKAVIYISKTYKQTLHKIIKNEKIIRRIDSKSYILPNGIDNFWLENTNKTARKMNSKTIRLVYAGKIERNKNIAAIIRAVEMLNTKGFSASLTIAGKIVDESEYNIINECENAAYVGELDKKGLAQLYRNSDIFVMVSHAETFGLVYVEAMSQGLPVIYTKNQGFDNQFPEGCVGYHASDRNPEEIVEAIKKIKNNYREISNNCIKKCKSFDWNNICKKYEAIYNTISKTRKIIQ